MKSKRHLFTLLIFLIGLPLMGQNIEPSGVKQIMEKVADWQIENHDDLKYRAQNSRLSRGKHHLLDWTMLRFMWGCQNGQLWQTVINIMSGSKELVMLTIGNFT